MRELARRVVFALPFAGLAFVAACGDDGGGGDGGDGGIFDDPSDFERDGCDADGQLESVDPAGIWHLNMVFEGVDGDVAAMSIDPAGGEGQFRALLFGDDTDDVRLSADDLFIRREDNVDGQERVFALDLCRELGDGVLGGRIAACYDGECVVGEAEAYPVAPLDEPEAENMTLVSEWEGGGWDEEISLNVRHLGTVAYLVRASDGLRIVDLADPAAPADLGHLPAMFAPDEYYNDIKVAEAGDGRVYAYLGSNLRGVVIADVTDPAAPVEVTAFPPAPSGGGGVNVHTLFIEGDRVYAAHTSIGGLQIYDVADPTSPVPLGTYVHPDVGSAGGFVHDLFVQDSVAYLNYWNLGMVVLDAVDPQVPSVVGVFDGYERRTSHSSWVTEAGGRRIAIHGDEDFDSHVRVVDVDPESATAFQEIGAYQTRPAVSAHNLMAVGEIGLAAYYQDGLRVLDLADPTAPVEIAHYATWPGTRPDYGQSFFEGAIGVDYDAERELILLADSHRGLLVLTLDR